jgi:pyridoxal phosphate enzyme (YggS family)
MASIGANLQAVETRVCRALSAAGRTRESLALIAVSKGHPAERVAEAAAAGQRGFGENHVLEALGKMEYLRAHGVAQGVEWHLIGPLQSNKTRLAAERFDWVHSVDRERIARRLSEQRPAAMPPLQVLVQVNSSGEASKSGVAPEQAAALARAILALPGLRLRGLMTVPEPAAEPARLRRRFASLRELYESLQREGLALDTLSMGMSADFEDAIAEGSTMVRVGTAIFGERNRKEKVA